MGSKIIRTPTRAEGGITESERAQMRALSEVWINRAFRTDPIEPDKIIPAIEGLYAAAGLKKPRVVIAPSPLVMAFAYGAASAIWAARKSATVSPAHDATCSATVSPALDATCSATYSATDSATVSATYSDAAGATDRATINATVNATVSPTRRATINATVSPTRRATINATVSPTRRATINATYRATRDAADSATISATESAAGATDSAATVSPTRRATINATINATVNATDSATESAAESAASGAARACFHLAGPEGLHHATRWWEAYQGGNMWAGWLAFHSAMRDIIGLRLPEYEKYHWWEQAGIHGGFRVLHEEFCIVSDFPERILIDENNRPHCDNGPSHRWRDGWALYHWHGVRVPAHWIEDRENLHPADVLAVENVEQRAAGAAIVGWPKMLEVLEAKVIHDSGNEDLGSLIELTLPGLPEPGRFLKARCPRNGIIVEAVPRVSDIDGLPIDTTVAAQAWRIGDPQSEYQHPPIRT